MNHRTAFLICVLSFFAASGSSRAGSDTPPPKDWYAQVTAAAGEVTLNRSAVHAGSFISAEGILATGKSGSAVVHFRGKGADLTLAPGTRVVVRRPDPVATQAYEIESGTCRWSVKASGSPTQWLRIRTRSATLGVRGTDFAAIYNPLLGESEVVVFEGTVRFGSVADPQDFKDVPPGHWGGVGGRFGKRIGELIPLSPEILKALKTPVDVAATVPSVD